MQQPIPVGSKVRITTGRHAGREGILTKRNDWFFGRGYFVEKQRSFLKLFHFVTTVQTRPDQIVVVA
jgi:hypothetical protein